MALTLGVGLAPLGALVGGFLGEVIGVRPTVLVAVLGGQLGFVILI